VPTFNTENNDHRSGFVAIVGAPNSGKSTLLNRLLGEKISITSKKPQTTRNRILGILTLANAQCIFMDTPGIFQAGNPLNRRIVDVSLSAMEDADVILLLTDITQGDASGHSVLFQSIKDTKKPVVLALNKIDLVKKNLILSCIAQWQDMFPFQAIIPMSAKTGEQTGALVLAIQAHLPKGPAFFPPDSLTDVSERFIVSELIREKVFRLTGQEIPYSVAVTIETFKEKKASRLVEIGATIHVERDSQKAIVIGKGGAKLKSIGEAARVSIEHLLGTKVFLQLFVRVEKNWSKDTRALQKFGY
jgi:GTP-binding protein Era